MTDTTFRTQPKARCAARYPGDSLMRMTAENRDLDGRRWPRGTTYQPASHGNGGYTVTIISGRPLPGCNDAQGWE